MSNLASVIVQSPPSITPAHTPSSSPDLELGGRSPRANDNIAQAEAWARKAYNVLRAAGVGFGTYDREDAQRRMRSTAENPDNVCDAALGAVFFNLGMLKEVSHIFVFVPFVFEECSHPLDVRKIHVLSSDVQ